MEIINITTARDEIYTIAAQTILSHEPVVITTKQGSVVMMSLEDYESIKETMDVLQGKPNLLNDIKDAKENKEFYTEEQLEW